MIGEVQVRADATVARLHGELDLVTVDALRDLLDDVCAGPAQRVVVDLSDVPFIDVLSLSVVLGAADGLRDDGRQLVVESAGTSVRRMCELLNAEDVLAPPPPLHLVEAQPAR
jgi:anti-sigma B factor antagonist